MNTKRPPALLTRKGKFWHIDIAPGKVFKTFKKAEQYARHLGYSPIRSAEL